MPADEWIIDVQDFGDGNWSGGKSLYVDSVYVPKVDVRVLARNEIGSFKNPVPFKGIGKQFAIPANKGAKLWVLTAWYNSTDDVWQSEACSLSRVKLFMAERYLGFRGSR
jgi:hypothetical protein